MGLAGTAADSFKLALDRVFDRRAQAPPFIPVLAVHDELDLECAEQDAQQVAAWLESCMREAGGQVLGRVPIGVEVEIGESWAEDDE